MQSKKSTSYFENVDLAVDFPKLESEILKMWSEKKIVEKYLNKNTNSSKHFSFMDGPITANNPMGVHHAWGRTYKDIWQRFKNMQGYKQRFQNGFDAQGLWVEVEVEKDLGFTSKKQIEGYGVAKFVQKCKERVYKFAEIQTQQSKRLAYFMDWDNSFFTLSDENNYMIWHFIKTCDDHGWLYKGNDSVPWCPRCETAISQHEILTDDYKEVVHEAVYFALPIKDRDEYLLVWTTTPWTLPANIAVAINKKLIYILIEQEGKKYWLAKDALNRIFGRDFKILKKVLGSELTGLYYSGIFDDLPAVKKVSNHKMFHQVVATVDQIMPINTQEGTGLVHTAVSAGTEDYKLGQKLGLPMIPVISNDASYLDGLGFLAGKNAKKNPKLILDYMVNKGFVFKIENYKHRYPGCWRCKTELVWKVTDEWYIAMDKNSKLDRKGPLRERMINSAKKIRWIPKFGLKRELDWLNNMHDWLISKKNRYWGLCLPIWECGSCGNVEVIGSKEELKSRAVSGWNKFEGHSPQKPYLDFVTIKCSRCREHIKRIEPVGNPWLDAGIVPFSTISKDNKSMPLYLSDKKQWEKWFPANFITESFPGQFKNWFYSLIAMSSVLEGQSPVQTVLGFATMTDENGHPFHKSSGNAIEFVEGAQKAGADIIRWICARQNPVDNIFFGYNLANEIRRRFYLKIWNVYNFFVTFANIDNFKPDKKFTTSTNILDIWILVRLNELVYEVTHQLDEFDASRSAQTIELFVDDLSNWYLRRSRDRGGFVANKKDKDKFYQTLFRVLKSLSLTLAPFMPFISEVIYKNLTKNESVHLADWPTYSKLTKSELSLINEMHRLRVLVERVHAKRRKENLPVKRPLLKLIVTSKVNTLNSKLLEIAADELNIKEVVWKMGKRESLIFDKKMTPILEEEQKTRELIRSIQNERKVMMLSLTQKIHVENEWIPTSKLLVQELLNKTQSVKIVQGQKLLVHKV